MSGDTGTRYRQLYSARLPAVKAKKKQKDEKYFHPSGKANEHEIQAQAEKLRAAAKGGARRSVVGRLVSTVTGGDSPLAAALSAEAAILPEIRAGDIPFPATEHGDEVFIPSALREPVRDSRSALACCAVQIACCNRV